MPKVPKPGASADHQRTAETAALRRVKKLLAKQASFDGEDDRVLRVRDEYLASKGPVKPTLSAAEADALIAALPTGPRSGITLRTELPPPSADPRDKRRFIPSSETRQRTPVLAAEPEPLPSSIITEVNQPTPTARPPRQPTPTLAAPPAQDHLSEVPPLPTRRSPLEPPASLAAPPPAAPPSAPPIHVQPDPEPSLSSSSDESVRSEAPRPTKRVRTPTPPLAAADDMFGSDSDTDTSTASPLSYRPRFGQDTERTAPAFAPATSLYEKRTSNPRGVPAPRRLKSAPALSEIAFSPIGDPTPLAPPTQVYTPSPSMQAAPATSPSPGAPATQSTLTTAAYASDRLQVPARLARLDSTSGINQIAVADRFTPLKDSITCDQAEKFHLQVLGGIYKHSPASDAISGRARNDVHLRLTTDVDQLFVHPDLLSEWWTHIDCALLATIVLHYFGPQVDKHKTLEEAFHTIPLIYSLGNHEDELATYHAHKELLELHERTYGALTERQNLTLSKIISKRLKPNS